MLSLFSNKNTKISGVKPYDAVIVVPVYKHFNKLEKEEKISLQSAFKHFSLFRFAFIGPELLEIKDYLSFAHDYFVSADFYSFEDKYFSGKDSYSRLLVSKFFYERFSHFNYMLICQTDAFVFQNDLQTWMDRGFTYIGAPWVTKDLNGKIIITGSGNGGFSLRKIDDFINLSKRIELLQLLNLIWKKNVILEKIPFGLFLRLVAAPLWLRCSINKFTFYLSEDKLQNEDMYWCDWVSKVFSDFRNAPAWLCADFAIEEEPRYLMNELDGSLPMACHAWAINDPAFWRNYIIK